MTADYGETARRVRESYSQGRAALSENPADAYADIARRELYGFVDERVDAAVRALAEIEELPYRLARDRWHSEGSMSSGFQPIGEAVFKGAVIRVNRILCEVYATCRAEYLVKPRVEVILQTKYSKIKIPPEGVEQDPDAVGVHIARLAAQRARQEELESDAKRE